MTNKTHNTNPVKTKPRRWFRFRLRTLLILVTVVSIPLGWVGWELDQRKREKEVVAWVEEMDRQAYFHSNFRIDERSWWEKKKGKWFGERVRSVLLDHRQVNDLSPLADLKQLEYLDLSDSEVNDLSPLSDLNNLTNLGLSNTPVSDLSPLAELKNLEWLDLSDTQVSDLSPLAELKNLQQLTVVATQVSDLSPLAELKNLAMLDLYVTQVGDLSPLAELNNLKWLRLNDTRVSDEQVQELRQALPNCEISF